MFFSDTIGLRRWNNSLLKTAERKNVTIVKKSAIVQALRADLRGTL